MDAGVSVAEYLCDAPDSVRAPVDGWRADDEGALRAGAFHGFVQGLLDDVAAAVQAPWVAARAECGFGHGFTIGQGFFGLSRLRFFVNPIDIYQQYPQLVRPGVSPSRSDARTGWRRVTRLCDLA